MSSSSEAGWSASRSHRRSIRAGFRRSSSTRRTQANARARPSTAAPAQCRRARCGCWRRSAWPITCRCPAARSGRSRSRTAFSPAASRSSRKTTSRSGSCTKTGTSAPRSRREQRPAETSGSCGNRRRSRSSAERTEWWLRSKTAESFVRRCWPPWTGETPRRARRRESRSPAGNTTIWRWFRRFGTSGRTTTSPTRFSSRPARSRCCR